MTTMAKPVLLQNRLIFIWLGLVLVTLLSWWLGADHGLSATHGRTIGMTSVLAVAFLKILFIGNYFMELRTAPMMLRLVFGAWVIGVGGIVIALYLGAN